MLGTQGSPLVSRNVLTPRANWPPPLHPVVPGSAPLQFLASGQAIGASQVAACRQRQAQHPQRARELIDARCDVYLALAMAP